MLCVPTPPVHLLLLSVCCGVLLLFQHSPCTVLLDPHYSFGPFTFGSHTTTHLVLTVIAVSSLLAVVIYSHVAFVLRLTLHSVLVITTRFITTLLHTFILRWFACFVIHYIIVINSTFVFRDVYIFFLQHLLYTTRTRYSITIVALLIIVLLVFH